MLNNQRVAISALALIALALAVLIGRDIFVPAPATIAAVKTASVSRGTVRAAVTATGTVEPAGQLNVNFRLGGQLVEVDARVGDKVKSGQVLARIDSRTQQVAVQQAQANLATAYANLQSALTPATPEQVAQLQHNLASARTNYDQTVAQNSQTSQQDAQQLQVDQQQQQTDQNQVATDQQQQQTDQNTVSADQQALTFNSGYQNDLYNLGVFQTQLATDQARFNQDGCQLQTYPYQGQCFSDYSVVANDQSNLNRWQSRVNTDTATLTADQAKVTADQNRVTADQNKVGADQQKVQGDQSKATADQLSGQRSLSSAQASIQSAQDSLAIQTSTKASTIASSQAAILSSQAGVDTAQLNLDLTTLYAPVDGTVTALNGGVSETVGAGAGTTAQAPGSSAPIPSTTGTSASSSAFMTISSDGGMAIVIPFAESDAAKVAANQTASITFDAVTGLNIPAHVLAVATTATIVSNVVNYYATLTLDRADPRVKQGMTANANVTVAQASNVLTVPNTALKRVGQRAFLTELQGGKQVLVAVQLGTAGDSMTEIRSGAAEGDKIVLPNLTAPSGTGARGAGGGGGIRIGGGGGG